MKHKRSIAIIITAILSMNTIGCSMQSVKQAVKETADTATNTVEEAATTAKDTVIDWYSSLDFSKFQAGWDYSVEFLGAQYSAVASSEYVASVESAISTLKADMNASMGSARGTAQEAGFLAEKWATDTFNIDAIAGDSTERANTVGSTGLGSVDVETTYGENASMKYYQDSTGVQSSAAAQARSIMKAYYDYCQKASGEPLSLKEFLDKNGYDPEMSHDELYASIYEGQTRVIPTDQLSDAKLYLQGKIDKLAPAAGGDVTDAQIKAYQETMDNLRDRIQAPDGTQSKPLTYQELQAIAEVSKDGEFKPEDFGITLSSVISPKYVVKQAVGTGVQVAAMNTVLTVGPDVFSILKEAAVTGIVDQDALKDAGVEGAIAASEGFVEGSISRMVTTLCQSGALGSALQEANPSVVATLTILVIEGAIHGYELSQGKITAEEYGNMMVDRLMVSMLALPTSALFLAILPGTHICILAGCLAGGLVASIGYLMVKDAVLDMVDGGGFEAIIPIEAKSTMSVASEQIASMNITDNISTFKDTCISTANNGMIQIQALVNQ